MEQGRKRTIVSSLEELEAICRWNPIKLNLALLGREKRSRVSASFSLTTKSDTPRRYLNFHVKSGEPREHDEGKGKTGLLKEQEARKIFA